LNRSGANIKLGDIVEREHARKGSPPALNVVVRPACAADADACAPLIFASGRREFSYMLGTTPNDCIAFLRNAFAGSMGRFSYRRHFVAVNDGLVCAVLAAHRGGATILDDPHFAWSILRSFGVRRACGIAARGLILESELPAPKRNQMLLAHCATNETVRGQGVFTTLFNGVMREGFIEATEDCGLVLDVLISNRRAHALYQRLGFVDMPRLKARSPQLPASLRSIRMAWCGPQQDRFVHQNR
jgi:GNAT superfamily N-acetyltransferase